jgi:hypothetical protein
MTDSAAPQAQVKPISGDMERTEARSIAYARHGERRNRVGEPMVEHLERVAASVPGEARTVAYLHDILEHTDASVAELEADGVTPLELQAVQLLTRHPDESFEEHTLRIAFAQGPAGRLARMVKLADIDDHLSRGSVDTSRPFVWARRHVSACRARFDRQYCSRQWPEPRFSRARPASGPYPNVGGGHPLWVIFAMLSGEGP